MGDDITRVVHVRGDTEADYGEVVAVMDKLATNGITHIAIMTNSRGKAARLSIRCAGSAVPLQPREERANDRHRDGARLCQVARPAPSSEFPPVKPRWLGPAATVAVVLAHVGVAVFLMATAIEKYAPLESVSMDLIPEGDMFESQKVEASGRHAAARRDRTTRSRHSPAHADDSGRAADCRRRRKSSNPGKHVVERKEVDSRHAKEHREAQEHHRLGMAGGRAQSGGVSQSRLMARCWRPRSVAMCRAPLRLARIGVL